MYFPRIDFYLRNKEKLKFIILLHARKRNIPYRLRLIARNTHESSGSANVRGHLRSCISWIRFVYTRQWYARDRFFFLSPSWKSWQRCLPLPPSSAIRVRRKYFVFEAHSLFRITNDGIIRILGWIRHEALSRVTLNVGRVPLEDRRNWSHDSL